MDINKYRGQYNVQRYHAEQRGIAFKLTFQEWCEFWGADIDRRGSSPDSLQMQRFADTGAYELGNIRKGTPRQNGVTAGHMKRKRNCDAAALHLQIELDALMNQPSKPDQDENSDEYEDLELWRFKVKSSHSFRYHFNNRRW